eukprot:518124-Pyramimonas_sp.AAC.1
MSAASRSGAARPPPRGSFAVPPLSSTSPQPPTSIHFRLRPAAGGRAAGGLGPSLAPRADRGARRKSRLPWVASRLGRASRLGLG